MCVTRGSASGNGPHRSRLGEAGDIGRWTIALNQPGTMPLASGPRALAYGARPQVPRALRRDRPDGGPRRQLETPGWNRLAAGSTRRRIRVFRTSSICGWTRWRRWTHTRSRVSN